MLFYRTGRCVQHSDEQRRSVRDLLLGNWYKFIRSSIQQVTSSVRGF